MSSNNNGGPFPQSVFPESVFPRRIFSWMGDDEDMHEPQTQARDSKPKFPWEIEEDEQKDDD